MPQPYAIVVLSKVAASNSTIERDLEAIRDEINAAVDHHERLQCIVIAKEPWTVDNGRLTPTMKLKRSAIEERYAPFVSQWYESGKSVIRAES